MKKDIIALIAIAEEKAYCIDEFFRRLDAEVNLPDSPVGEVVLYTDGVDPKSYTGQAVASYMKDRPHYCSVIAGKRVKRAKDNIYNSRSVGAARSELRSYALEREGWAYALFWDVDVFPPVGGLGSLREVADREASGVTAGLVADWASEMPSIALFDEYSDDFKLVWPIKKLEREKDYTVGVTHMAFTLVSRITLEAVDFSSGEDAIAYGDDGVYCRRAAKMGIKIVTSTRIGSIHVHESGKGVACKEGRDGIYVEVTPKVAMRNIPVENAGEEDAILYVRDNAGGHFPAPIDWTFKRAEAVPIRLLGEERANLLLAGPAFRKIRVTRRDLEVAVDLF